MVTTSFNATQITPPRVPIIDDRTGLVSREWYRYFYSLYAFTGGGTGILPVTSGGTGLDTIPTDGQLLIGDTASSGYKLHVIDTGAGIAITNGSGTILITNTGVLSNIAGSGIGVSSATGNVTVSNTGVLSAIAGSGISVSSATGNVTFANTGVLSFSGGSTGLLPSSATTGAVSLSGTLGVGYGGTGQTTYTNGQLLIGNTTGNTLTKTTLTAGSGVSISNGAGSITISATGSGGTVTAVTGTAPVVSSGGTTPAISMPKATTSVDGYLSSTDWTTFNNKGSGTVTSVAALTLGTTGTDLSSTVATGTTTPVITLNVPTASASNRGALSSADWTTFNNKGSGTVTSVTATSPVASTGGTTPVISMPAATTSVSGYLTSTDWNTFNGKQPAGTYVTSVTGTAPVVSSGGTTPAISMAAASASVSGYLTSTDWSTFNSKGSGSVTNVSVATANGFSGTVATSTTTPVITIATGITGVLKGSSSALAAAVSGTDYVAPSAYASTNGLTMSTARLLGRTTAATGAAEEISVAGGLTLSAGVLTGTSGTVTSVTGTAPVVSSGGATPAISMAAATTSVNGYLTSTDWTTFNGKQAALVSGTNIKTVNGTTLLGSGDLGTIGATYGGTGQTVYAVGDLLYASTTTALSKLADVATGNALISGGVGVAPSYGKIGLTTHVSGTLPTANGGTNLTSFTANGIVYASSTSALATGSNVYYDGTTIGTVGRLYNGSASTFGASSWAMSLGNGGASTNYFKADSTYWQNAAGTQTMQLSAGTLTTANDASVNGLTVGRGGGAVVYNTAMGYQALNSNATGTSCVAIGYQALLNSTANSNVGIGKEAGSNATSGGNNIFIGVAAQAGVATDSGELVIGTNAATGKGSSTGFISPNSGGVYQGNNSAAWSITSDERLKKNIVDNNTGLDKILSIQVRNFEYRLPEEITELEKHCAIKKEGVQLGAIAQEMLAAGLSECVKTESTGVMSLNTDPFVWYLINAVKELKAEFDAYKEQHP